MVCSHSISAIAVSVDGSKNLFLLLLIHADACKGLARAAVRTDQGFIVCPGQGRMAGVA